MNGTREILRGLPESTTNSSSASTFREVPTVCCSVVAPQDARGAQRQMEAEASVLVIERCAEQRLDAGDAVIHRLAFEVRRAGRLGFVAAVGEVGLECRQQLERAAVVVLDQRPQAAMDERAQVRVLAQAPEEAVEVGCPVWAAAVAGEQALSGRLRAGMRADITALAADPLSTPPDDLPDVPVRLTVVDGEVVFEGV